MVQRRACVQPHAIILNFRTAQTLIIFNRMRCVMTMAAFALMTSVGFAQESFKARPSPVAIAAMRYKESYVKIVYSQPQKRNREIFGVLVPFGQVWRLGANEATEITTTKDILINNVSIKPGTYSLFAIPNADRWTIIINKDVGLWGAYNYNPKSDLVRFDLPVKNNPTVAEAFTITFDQNNDLANLLISWDKTLIEIPVKFIN
jgi:hypothetical protein